MEEIDASRGTGRTTNILKSVKPNGVFVWCNSNLVIPKRMAVSLNRADIKIISPEQLVFYQGFVGSEITDIRLDHATQLTEKQHHFYKVANSRIRQVKMNQPDYLIRYCAIAMFMFIAIISLTIFVSAWCIVSAFFAVGIIAIADYLSKELPII